MVDGHLASLSACHNEVLHGPLSQAVGAPQGGPERHGASSLEHRAPPFFSPLSFPYLFLPCTLAHCTTFIFLLPA